MRQRGRRSAASLSVVATTEAPRPAPPRSLSREAKAVWRAATARFRPDHFVGAEPVLEAYAEGVVMLRDLVERIKQTKASEPIDYKRLAVLMQLQKAQALLIGNLGGKLRLTPARGSTVTTCGRSRRCRNRGRLATPTGPKATDPRTAAHRLPGHKGRARAETARVTRPRDPFVVDMHCGSAHPPDQEYFRNRVLLLPESRRSSRSGGHGAGSPLSQPGLA